MAITPGITFYFSFVSYVLLSVSVGALSEEFLQCLILQSPNSSSITYSPNNSTYPSVLQFSIQNLRFATPSTPKPRVIVTPRHESEVQAVVNCSTKHGMQIRVRSGGHDYEGLSYVSHELPFVIIDLINLRSVSVDIRTATASVQAGATLGEIYHAIATASRSLAFTAGICPTVGVGGHFSGGGEGTLSRKYGLAADNIIDARLVDVNARILDRKSMGEDLFWAIRGGGGASFGVILAWKIKLVEVPQIVTVFTPTRTLEQNATGLVYVWQSIAEKFPEDLFIRVVLQSNSNNGKRTVQASFNSMYIGGVDRLLREMKESFPELGLVKEDCTEMSWIESVLYFNGYPRGQPLEILLDRRQQNDRYFKAKSDYVKEPIPVQGLQGIWKLLLEDDATGAVLIWAPYGGKMREISESAIPFPFRAGNLYQIQHLIYWSEAGEAASRRFIGWITRLYDYMTPFVSKQPRTAYLNYRDLDLGVNNQGGNTSFAQASKWGFKYFKNNFQRLVRVKNKVDPSNFFRNEQSIPVVST